MHSLQSASSRQSQTRRDHSRHSHSHHLHLHTVLPRWNSCDPVRIHRPAAVGPLCVPSVAIRSGHIASLWQSGSILPFLHGTGEVGHCWQHHWIIQGRSDDAHAFPAQSRHSPHPFSWDICNPSRHFVIIVFTPFWVLI